MANSATDRIRTYNLPISRSVVCKLQRLGRGGKFGTIAPVQVNKSFIATYDRPHQAWLSSGHARQISVRQWLSARSPRLPEFATLGSLSVCRLLEIRAQDKRFNLLTPFNHKP